MFTFWLHNSTPKEDDVTSFLHNPASISAIITAIAVPIRDRDEGGGKGLRIIAVGAEPLKKFPS